MRRPGPAILAGGAVLLLALVVALGPGGDDGRVVAVYTAHSQDALDALLPDFERRTGIRAEVVKLGSGEVLQRALAERERPRADVIWSVGADQLHAHPELLEPYQPPGWADQVDPAFARPGQPWLPYTAILGVLVVNGELGPDAAPRGWADLARPELAGRVVAARPDKSGSAYMQLVTILSLFGDRGWEVYRGVLANTRLTDSSSAVPRLVNDGEAAVGLTLEDSAQRYVEAGGPVRIVYPAEGTFAAPDGLALVRGGPHPAEARAFVDWALSRETQALLVERLARRAVRRDVPAPRGLPPLGAVKVTPYDFAAAAAGRDRHLEAWSRLAAELGR